MQYQVWKSFQLQSILEKSLCHSFLESLLILMQRSWAKHVKVSLRGSLHKHPIKRSRFEHSKNINQQKYSLIFYVLSLSQTPWYLSFCGCTWSWGWSYFTIIFTVSKWHDPLLVKGRNTLGFREISSRNGMPCKLQNRQLRSEVLFNYE